MPGETPKDIVQSFWNILQTNDFARASLLLDEAYTLHFPQSGETFSGRADFIRFNSSYPASGRWQFEVHQLVAEGRTVVSDVSVTDGAVTARVVSFSTVEAGLIRQQVEFWPEPFDVPEWRQSWSKRG